MGAAPSSTSAIDKNFHQQQSQVIEPYHFEENRYTPSMSDIRSPENQSHPDLSFEAGSVVPRAIVQPTQTYNDGGQPVSIGSMAVRGRESQYPLFPDQLTDTSDYGGQAPSIGSMVRDGGTSQTAGSNFNHPALPSYNDVGPRDPSYTGESGGGQNLLPEGNYEGMTLNGRQFGKIYTEMLQNDDEYNPYRRSV